METSTTTGKPFFPWGQHKGNAVDRENQELTTRRLGTYPMWKCNKSVTKTFASAMTRKSHPVMVEEQCCPL